MARSRLLKYNLGLSFFFVVAIYLPTIAQLKADFEADTLHFCPPYTVKFNDLSTGGRIISRRWDFGQGGSSNNNDPFPSASYIQSGSYTVKLVVSDGSQTDSITKTSFIKVHSIPIAAFTTNATPRGCKPLDLTFVDNSIVGDAPISKYDWNLGNGNRANSSNPRYRYQNDGKYTVVLTVTDTNDCYSSTKKLAYVDVLPGPKVKFSTSNPPSNCLGPYKVNFVNLTTGMQPITYSWNLGNGSSSGAVSPSGTYNSGVYNVTLIATDSAGCKDTLVRPRYVTVGNAKADFSFSADTFCLTDTNTIKFTNLSVGGNIYNWDFGDGTTSKLKDPEHRFSSTGTYQVKLHISSGPGCVDQITKSIHVIQPKIDFSSDINYWCDDTIITLTPKSTYQHAATRLWWLEFDDWDTTKTGFSPQKFSKQITGWHTDTLFAFYPKWGSCRDSVFKKSIRIWKPSGNLITTPVSGCAPLTVTYNHNIGPVDSLIHRHWVIGGQVVNTNPVTRTYSQHGSYSAMYRVKHVKGCQYNYSAGVQVGLKPNADFKVAKTGYCANEKVEFRNLSTDSTLITNYFWSLDMNAGAYSFNRHEEHSYADTGYKSTFLVVSHNGCADTIIKRNFIKVLGPTGSFGIIANCDSVYKVEMAPLFWTDYHRFKYDFGDFGGIDSSDTKAKYHYLSRGNYDIKLTLYNDSNDCEVETIRKVKIREVKLNSSINKRKECYPFEFKFNTSNSQDVESGRILIYGVDSTPRNFKQFPFESMTKGAQRPMLIGYDVNGCPDTNRLWLKTYRPEVKIIASVDSGCGPLNVQFTDSTDNDTTVSYKRWFLAHHGRSAVQHPFQIWKRPGSHEVILKIVDAMGCYGEDYKTIKVISPVPDIAVKKQVCIGETVVFSNPLLKDKEQLFWNFGNGVQGTGDSATTSYSSPGRKTIHLRVVDSLGCDSSITKTQHVKVQRVNRPTVVALPNDTNCYPAEISYLVTSTDTNNQYFYWRFDSSEAYIRRSVPSAFYTYDIPGEFGFDLKVETSFGCKDSFRYASMVNIGGPYARFNAPDTLCLGTEAEFKLTESKNVYKFSWDFGDGIIDTINGDSVNAFHTYYNTGTYPIFLIFSDSLGDCVKSFSDTIEVQSVSAQITLNDTIGCTEFELEADASDQPVDRYNWFLNGNFIANTQSLKYTVKPPGKYILALQSLNTITGCNAIDTAHFEVFPLPILETDAGGIFCLGDSVSASVTGAQSYKWSPSTFLKDSIGDSVLLSPEKDMVYTITGTDVNGCISDINISYKVVEPPRLRDVKDTTLFLGETIKLEQENNPEWNYSWEPSLFLSCNDCPSPDLEGNRNITYTVSVSDKHGCFVFDSTFQVFVEDDYSVLIPNAFTPNGDGLNDEFRFFARGIEEVYFFGIYSRWGELIYEFKDVNDSWDGSYRGEPWKTNSKLVYKGELKRFNGEVVELSGYIVLVK